MSNKIALVGTAVIMTGAVWAGTTWCAGVQVERMYQQAVQAINQDSLSGFHVQLTAFERGFFRSRANWEVSYQLDPCQPDDKITLTRYDSIQQGFIPSLGWASIDSHIIWSDALQPTIKRIFADQPPLTIHAKLSLLGTLSVNVNSPAGHWRNQQAEIEWQGVHAQATWSSKQKTSIDVRVPRIKVASMVSNGQDLLLNDIRYQGQQFGKQSLLTLGDAQASVAKLALNYMGQQWTLNGLSMENKNELKNQFLTATGQYRIQHIMLNQKNIGDFKAQFVLDKLNAQAVQQAYEGLARLQQQCQPSAKQTLQVWQPIMQAGFEFALDSMDLDLFGGTAHATANIKMPPRTNTDVADDTAQWLRQLTADAELLLPHQFLEGVLMQVNMLKGEPISSAQAAANVEMLLQGYVQQQKLRKLKEGYQLKFQLHDGQPMLNGKPLS